MTTTTCDGRDSVKRRNCEEKECREKNKDEADDDKQRKKV